jgi:hypothetical protein
LELGCDEFVDIDGMHISWLFVAAVVGCSLLYQVHVMGAGYDLKAQAFSKSMEDLCLFLSKFGETGAHTRPILKRYEDGTES